MSARVRLDSLLAQYHLTAWSELINVVIAEAVAIETRQLRNDITGACLARYEEEQENERLRLAWHSARERAKAHSEGTLRQVANRDTWMGWAKTAEAEVVKLRARIAELETAAVCPSVARLRGSKCVLPVRHRGDHQDETKRHYWSDDYAVPRQRQVEDPHDGPLHHDYALGRDLPAIPHQRDEEAL